MTELEGKASIPWKRKDSFLMQPEGIRKVCVFILTRAGFA
jgi:hypothetical protein